MYGLLRFPWLIIHKLMGFKLIPASILNPAYAPMKKKELKEWKKVDAKFKATG